MDSLELEAGERRNVKFYVAAYLACALTREMDPSAEKVLYVEPPSVEDAVVKDCYKRVLRRYEALGMKEEKDRVARGTELLKHLRADIRRQLSRKRTRS